MRERHNAVGEPSALLIVRNAFDHDSRVLRAAHTLRSLGYTTTVLAVFSWTERRQLTVEDGIQVKRIGPTSRFAWFVYRQVSSLAPVTAGVREMPVEQASAPRPGSRLGDRLLAGLKPVLRPFMRWASTMVYYRQGIAEVVGRRPDLVHCNDYNTMWIGLAARCFAGSRVLYDSHELWPDRNLRPEPRWWLILCERLFVRLAHEVITASPGYSQVMAERYGIEEPPAICNVPTVAEPDLPPLPPLPRDRPPRVAVYVGGMIKNRGIEQSIEALALAPDVHLRLVGPGGPGYRAELADVVERVGVGDRVEFVPPVRSEDVVRTLSTADVGLCLIQPVTLSYRLTMPNKLFEYVLAGLPVLGSDFPNIGEFIHEHGVGQTVDPEDPTAIARALREMLDPERNARYRTAAAEAARIVRWEAEQIKLIKVYADLLPAAKAA